MKSQSKRNVDTEKYATTNRGEYKVFFILPAKRTPLECLDLGTLVSVFDTIFICSVGQILVLTQMAGRILFRSYVMYYVPRPTQFHTLSRLFFGLWWGTGTELITEYGVFGTHNNKPF